jgi:putative Mg2+ transporter-C (MgtC) family protein
MINEFKFLSGFEAIFLIDILLSLAAGFVIGAERESRGKDAGISTHTFVIVGSMLFSFLAARTNIAIATQIISGIGFLGAGLILKDGTKVRNLTTAASLWYAAAIGMAFGFDFHAIGIIGTIMSIIIPRLPHISKKSPEAKADKI